MVTRALLVLALVACQGGDRPSPGAGTASEPNTDDAKLPSGLGGSAGSAVADDTPQPPPADAMLKPEEPEPPDPGKVIAELGAIPAWQAVIDRSQLLARRNQRGVVYGRVGPAILMPAPPPAAPLDGGVSPDAGMIPSPYVWLVDDTDGNGSLGIRVRLGDKLAGKANEGDRVALGGAWKLDDDRRWYWDVDALEKVPPATPLGIPDAPAPAPSHAIADGNLPQGARMIASAKDHDAVYFQIVGPAPVTDGDGWPVANELGDPVFALMILPGERSSYGGQDMRTPDERWQLKRGQTYWVRIGKIRKRGADKPAIVYARTAPIRVK